MVTLGCDARPAQFELVFRALKALPRQPAIVQLAEIAAQGVDSARDAITAACEHDNRSISGPAKAVLRNLEADE